MFWQERDLLRAAGHNVLEYQRSNRELEHYSPLRRMSLVGRTVWAPDSHREFTALLRKHRPDIVHVHNTFPLISPSVYWACRGEQVPVVQTLHNYRLFCPGANCFRAGRPCEDCIDGNFWQGAAHGCYRGSRTQTAAVALMLAVHHAHKTWTRMVDRYIVLTAFARSRFVKAGLPAEKITVKPNCVNPDPGKRQGKGSYALFVGRVSQEKGAHTLLRAWRRLPSAFSLRIAGDGPSSAQLESEVRAQNLSNVTFLGRLPREQVIAAMKNARFVIFPSELYENLPLTIIEAFACGVPVLASNLGAMQEIVEDGSTGLFFQPGDAEDLARTVTRALEQPEYVCRLGEQARKEYEAKYTASEDCRRLLEIYQRVITERQPQTGQAVADNLEETPSA